MDYSYEGSHPPTQLAAMAASYSPKSSSYLVWLADSGCNAHAFQDIALIVSSTPCVSDDHIAIGNGKGPSSNSHG